MKNDKLSTSLVSYLGANKGDTIDVIIELASLPVNNSTVASSGKTKIEIYKEIFQKASKPVERFIKKNGGSILDVAWINKTIKANIQASLLKDLAEQDAVAAIDLPGKIQRETE